MNIQTGIFYSLDDVLKIHPLSEWKLLQIDMKSVFDRKALFRCLSASLPMDPPIQSDRSWDALSDSIWGGVIYGT